jgi:DNA-directed RNA polymerase specialized sigma24 family protein
MNSQLKLGDRVNDCEGLSNSQGNPEALNVLFLRYRRTLLLVAYRVLGDHNQAEDAVQRCLQSAAFRNVPRFETEGAFRSWLVRVLIDVALFILQEREWAARIVRTDLARIYPIDPKFV